MPLLSIDIAASYAKFQDAMTAIERSAKKSASNLEGAFRGVNGVLAGLGVTVSAGALAALVKSSIDAADHINDLSKRTGVAVEVLGGIGFAAAQAGSSLDGVASVIGKLNKSIAEAGSGNAEIGEAFKKLGVDVADGSGSLKKADQILIELADKFPKYAEGPEKAALANRIFKKSYEEVLPLLADGAEALQANIEYFKRYSGLTQDVAEKSDAFNDSLEKMHLLSGAAGNQIAAELLPVLQLLVDKMVEVKESGDGFGSIGKGINTAIEAVSVLGVNTSYVFKQVGNEIGGIAAQLGALLRADPGGLDRDASGFSAISTIAQMMREDAAAAREEVDRATAEILSPNKGQVASEVMETLNPKPEKPTADRLSSGTDPAIARLAAELRELERMNQRERELLSTRNDFLQEYYDQDLIAIGDYYAARKAASDEALAAQVTNIDKEIALLRARRGKDATETTQNEAKIQELIERRADLQQRADLEAIRNIVDQTRKTEELRRAIEDVNTELLEQQGNAGEAAARRFDERNKQLRLRLESELAAANSKPDVDGVTTVRGSKALGQLNKLRDIAIAQGKLNDIQGVGERIQSDLAIASERAAIAAQNGSITELESLRAVSDARAQAAVDLKAVADAYTDMAAKTGNPAIIQRAKEMQVEVEKLAGSADLVREKFQGVFESGFDSFFDKLLSGTASIKDAFKSLFNDIAMDIAKIGIKDLTSQLFSKSGSFGGIVDLFSNSAGGKPTAAEASSGVISAVAGSGSDSVATTALASLATSTGGVDAAMLALGISAPTFDGQLLSLATTGIAAQTMLDSVAASAFAASTALDTITASAATSSTSSGAGEFIGIFADMFSSTAAKGNIYASGNLIPFAKGGVPGIVDTPTTFPMFGGRTGLMGEAGPEAIMPLRRDKHGKLAIRMIAHDGAEIALPLARDSAGRLAVRAADQSGSHDQIDNAGAPGIVNEITPFQTSSGESGVMGRGGPEAIVPVAYNKSGDPAIPMLNHDGSQTLLPILDQGGGRLALRQDDDPIIHEKFAKGGVPGIVDTPTLFAMAGGKTGLMGEAGPEAIMPLGRDKDGRLAIRMLDEHGATKFLPLARDAVGRLAVRAGSDSKIQKFAMGGVVGVTPDFRTNSTSALAVADERRLSAVMSQAPVQALEPADRTVIHQTIKVEVPGGTSRESADQIAQRTAVALTRSQRRNG